MCGNDDTILGRLPNLLVICKLSTIAGLLVKYGASLEGRRLFGRVGNSTWWLPYSSFFFFYGM